MGLSVRVWANHGSTHVPHTIKSVWKISHAHYSSPRRTPPHRPVQVFWSYEQGTTVADPTYAQFGEYYGRLVAHYVEGGFQDEYGVWVPGYVALHIPSHVWGPPTSCPVCPMPVNVCV